MPRKVLVSMFVIALIITSVLSSNLTSVHATSNDADIRNLALGLEYELSSIPTTPDDNYELTNGKYGTHSFSHPSWQGHLRGFDKTVTFDLKEKKSISKINAHFLQDVASGIYYPEQVKIEVSNNGNVWGTLATIDTNTPTWDPAISTQHYVWDSEIDGHPLTNPNAEMVYAQYVKITFRTDVWVFLDEIEIWGTDGKQTNAKVLPSDKQKPEKELTYLEPGEATDGITDLALLYNGHYPERPDFGDWKKEDLIPYISYVDENQQPTDWMFNGILYIGLRAQSGKDLAEGPNPATMEDWQWYLDKTFAEGGDLAELNEAAKEVGGVLGEPDHKVKVVITIPYPSWQQANFGDVDGDGETENFAHDQVGEEQALENKKEAINWYIHEALSKWNEENYSNLDLSAFYWVGEKVYLTVPYEEDLMKYTSNLVHQEGLKHFWIPYFHGDRFWKWQELGFDAAAHQPNYFFQQYPNPTRLKEAAELAKRFGLGVEIESHEGIAYEEDTWRNLYSDYLNAGVDYGFMENSFHPYYQGGDAYLQSARSDNPEARQAYDWTYEFINGVYEKK